jgi:DNA-binding NtrC family response regulator
MDEDKPLILIVDDESDSLTYLFDLLGTEGYRVLPTSNPMEAIDYVLRKHPAVIISDLRMPDLDGIELLVRVKHLSPKTRVILLTAHGDWSIYQEALQKGCDRMLLKPSSNEQILWTVRHALEEVNLC